MDDSESDIENRLTGSLFQSLMILLKQKWRDERQYEKLGTSLFDEAERVLLVEKLT